MGWETSKRKQSLPADWPKLRKKILVRDGYKCQWRFEDGTKCLQLANQVDHIVRGNNHSPSNLRALCEYHHNYKSAAEGSEEYWSRVEASKKKFRTDEVHPAYRQIRRG